MYVVKGVARVEAEALTLGDAASAAFALRAVGFGGPGVHQRGHLSKWADYRIKVWNTINQNYDNESDK